MHTKEFESVTPLEELVAAARVGTLAEKATVYYFAKQYKRPALAREFAPYAYAEFVATVVRGLSNVARAS